MGADKPPTALKKPSRSMALFLGLIGPRGTGQFYLGQTKLPGTQVHSRSLQETVTGDAACSPRR
jgi:hypothetical protein